MPWVELTLSSVDNGDDATGDVKILRKSIKEKSRKLSESESRGNYLSLKLYMKGPILMRSTRKLMTN